MLPGRQAFIVLEGAKQAAEGEKQSIRQSMVLPSCDASEEQ